MKTLLERFNDKHTKTEAGCWEWSASRHRQGYGRIRLGKKEGKTLQAHRVSYELFIGEIPNGKLVCHKCDNPACVNPDHLFLGTHKDNMEDKYSKGRQGILPKGELCRNSRFKNEDVLFIRDSPLSVKELAVLYNTTTRYIYRILSRERSSHL